MEHKRVYFERVCFLIGLLSEGFDFRRGRVLKGLGLCACCCIIVLVVALTRIGFETYLCHVQLLYIVFLSHKHM